MRRLLRVLAVLIVITPVLLMSIESQTAATGHWLDLMMASPVGPSITSWDALRRDVFVKGDDGTLWWKFWNGEQWSGWTSLGGNLTSAPDCVAPAAGLIQCVARGLFNWMMIKQGIFVAKDTMQWSDWKFVGGELRSAPTIVPIVLPNNIIEYRVYARGKNDNLWGVHYQEGFWREWFEIPGSEFQGDPDCVFKGIGEVDCALRSKNKTLLHNVGCCLSKEGTRWEDLSGTLNSDPTITAASEDRIDVLVRGQGDLLWRNTHNGQSWSGWFSVDSSTLLTDAPDCVSLVEGEADCAILAALSRSFYGKVNLR